MARAKGNYEDLVRLAVTELRVQTTVLSITLFPTQGFSSTTYSVELGDQTSIVVQVRPSDRPLALSNLDVARSTFGSLVPLGSFLTSNEDQDLLLYSMSQIPGRSLDSYLHEAATIPVIASSLGTILAKAIVPDTEVSELISSLGGEGSPRTRRS
ncbi:hypothetical protein BT96DRAFT_169077 [Gymnopus androsaceus JB14]|uniref:Aminoglycoside phosphotransferase domain-containing protein n=1 Tax=Gymnopus androsaceus JB14 TaxID=1447944 RepID=A0A6A4H9E1_9AGAR|nr:hypothetical protein BT96DRAFT_169077 [Gymnopus androsaceus JB14]